MAILYLARRLYIQHLWQGSSMLHWSLWYDFIQFVLSNVSLCYINSIIASFCLISTVCFQMCPQIVCPGRSIVTLVAFVWLFSNVCFRMSPQSDCMWGCKVTLVAFVKLFSTVAYFHFFIIGRQITVQQVSRNQGWKFSKKKVEYVSKAIITQTCYLLLWP